MTQAITVLEMLASTSRQLKFFIGSSIVVNHCLSKAEK